MKAPSIPRACRLGLWLSPLAVLAASAGLARSFPPQCRLVETVAVRWATAQESSQQSGEDEAWRVASLASLPWLGVGERIAQQSLEYRLQVEWVHLLPKKGPMGEAKPPEEAQQADEKIRAAISTGGDERVDVVATLHAAATLWEHRLDRLRYAKPGRFLLAQGQGRSLQQSLSAPFAHQLRTADFGLVYSKPPGTLFASNAGAANAPLYLPKLLLDPLPTRIESELVASWEWQSLGEGGWRAERTPVGQATVWIDDQNRPQSYWLRSSQQPRALTVGMFAWSQDSQGNDYPSRALTLRVYGETVSAMLYTVEAWRVYDESFLPILTIPRDTRIVDARGELRKVLNGPLPEWLRDLVALETKEAMESE